MAEPRRPGRSSNMSVCLSLSLCVHVCVNACMYVRIRMYVHTYVRSPTQARLRRALYYVHVRRVHIWNNNMGFK